MPIFERFCARFFENYFFWHKKDRRSGHFGRFSTLQNSSKEPTRCAIFGSLASHTACSGRGFCLGSFLNSTRRHVWSGPMKRSSGMPLCPFFSNLHAIQPWRRACSLHLRSSSISLRSIYTPYSACQFLMLSKSLRAFFDCTRIYKQIIKYNIIRRRFFVLVGSVGTRCNLYT